VKNLCSARQLQFIITKKPSMVLFTISSSTLNNEAVSSRFLIVFGRWYNEAGHDAPLN